MLSAAIFVSAWILNDFFNCKSGGRSGHGTMALSNHTSWGPLHHPVVFHLSLAAELSGINVLPFTLHSIPAFLIPGPTSSFILSLKGLTQRCLLPVARSLIHPRAPPSVFKCLKSTYIPLHLNSFVPVMWLPTSSCSLLCSLFHLLANKVSQAFSNHVEAFF